MSDLTWRSIPFVFKLLQEIKEYTLDVLIAINALVVQTVFNFTICYFADIVTNASLSIANILYNVEWFIFPISEQYLIKLLF